MKIQFKLNNIFAVEVNEKNSEYEEIINKAKQQLQEDILRNNETIENKFFESLEVVCSECGISLTNGEDEESFKCLQCEAEK